MYLHYLERGCIHRFASSDCRPDPIDTQYRSDVPQALKYNAGVVSVPENGNFEGTLGRVRGVVDRHVRMFSDDLVPTSIAAADDWNFGRRICVGSTTK